MDDSTSSDRGDHRLSSARAVQGVLFQDPQDEDDRRAFRGAVASRVSGITYRQLDYWDRRHIIEPSLFSSNGSGSRRLYSFKDIVLLSIAKRLLDAGVNFQNMTVAVSHLKQRRASELRGITLTGDGEHIRVCVSDAQVLSAVKESQVLFALSIGQIYDEVDARLHEEKCIDLDEQVISPRTGRVIDEFTAMRLRKQLKLRRQERAEA